MSILRWPLLLSGLFILVIFQTSTSEAFAIFGVGPQLVLIVLCCWAIVRPPVETLTMIPLAGVGLGLLAYQGMAESVAALAPIGFVALTWNSHSESPRSTAVAIEWARAILLIAVATLLHFAAHAIAVEISTTGVNWIAALRTVMLGSLLENVLVGAVIYWFVRIPTSGLASLGASTRSVSY
ncbi:MAG: hypothetical protein F4Y69_10630 [Chloroflexi bacterium]|nr:hypothetical protein [Chloroflexota bacterium]MYF23197.1 hypothetical protein [Chloroflexota bacterium]